MYSQKSGRGYDISSPIDRYIPCIYTIYMTTKVIFNADPKIKAKAMAHAKKQGITISYYLNQALVAFAEGTKRVEVVEKINDKTLRQLRKDYREIQAGKGVSPAFANTKDALARLHLK